MKIPNQIVMNGKLILFSGRGNAPGAYVFTDPQRGQVFELYLGDVVLQRNSCSIVSVKENHVLHRLEAPCGNQQVGNTVLVGPIVWSAAGPRALNIWTIGRPNFFHKPAQPQYSIGTLTEFKADRGFGRLITDRGENVFLHVSQLRQGVIPIVGVRYAFLKHRNPKGFEAQDVTVAA